MTPVARWHALVASKDLALVGLEELFTDDAVFLSPAVHKPQQGKALVCKYLRAAMVVLNVESFRYTDEWLAERSAVLQFELKLGEVVVNGVDLIKWNDAGLIVEFKVMVRPMMALSAVVAAMGAQLMK